MQTDFHNKYSDKILGTVNCLDRVILHGSLTSWGYSGAMNNYLIQQHIKVKDYPLYANTFNEAVRRRITEVALQEQITIEHIRSPHRFDKEDHIQKILLQRGYHEGIVHIYTVMEICDCYVPTFDKINHKAFLKNGTTKCLHYYIYFIDRLFGLCFFRIPTWIPFRVQFYFNGHNYLATKLQKYNIAFRMADNAFTSIADFDKAHSFSNDIRAEDIHASLDAMIARYIPFLQETEQSYRWTITQAEYSTDVIFKNANDMLMIYDQLVHHCIHAVKPGNIATFFSRKLAANYQQDVGNHYNTQIQGTRIKHHMGVNSIKMYNKDRLILRIETTINDVTEFKVFRHVKTRNGKTEMRWATMKKSIYSFYDLCQCCLAANMRYLDYLASFDDNLSGTKNLDKITQTIKTEERSYRGFNFFDPFDAQVLLSLESGEFNLHGLRNKTLRAKLKQIISSASVSRLLKRLLLHGIIKKVKNTYKYYLTKLGKRVLATAHIVKELRIIPAMN